MKKFIKIKPFQETLHMGMCGPASLKIVLGYYGIDKTEKELAKMLNWSKEIGIGNEDTVRVAKKLGFKVKLKRNSNFSDLKKWLDKKVPVIVDWFTRGRCDYPDSEIADGHYSVVAGIDDKYIYLQDPEIGKIRKLKKDDFLKVWFDFRGKYIKSDELDIRVSIAIYR
jgi:predicted double-glycine peptidase